MLGNLVGSFLQSYSQAKQSKEEREQREKENKAKTTLFEIQLRRAQQEEQAQQQQALMRDQFFSDARSMASPQNQNPMSLTELLADPQMGLRALQAGLATPGDLAAPKEPDAIATLRALSADPKLMAAEVARRQAGASRTEINTGDMLPKPEAGMYRPDPNKPGVLPEPGGSVDLERRQAEQKRASAAAASTAQGMNIVNTVSDAMKLVGPLTAGLGSKLNLTEGTAAYDLQATLNTIKASLSFDKLQEMRANSPTGGALGSTSDRELKLLESAVAALDQGQKPDTLKKNLQKVKDHYANWLATLSKAGIDESGAMGGGRVVDFNDLPE